MLCTSCTCTCHGGAPLTRHQRDIHAAAPSRLTKSPLSLRTAGNMAYPGGLFGACCTVLLFLAADGFSTGSAPTATIKHFYDDDCTEPAHDSMPTHVRGYGARTARGLVTSSPRWLRRLADTECARARVPAHLMCEL